MKTNYISGLLSLLKNVVQDETIKTKLETVFSAAKGSLTAVAEALHNEGVHADEINKISFAHSLAEVTGNNEALVKSIIALPHVNNIREFAFAHGKSEIAHLINENDIPKDVSGITLDERKLNYAATIHNKIFATETSAVLHRMATTAELPISDPNLRKGVASFFVNNPGFNIRTTSVLTAIKNPEAFKGIPEEHHELIINHLKTLQRVQAISPTPEAVAQLMKANFTTAFHVAEMTE